MNLLLLKRELLRHRRLALVLFTVGLITWVSAWLISEKPEPAASTALVLLSILCPWILGVAAFATDNESGTDRFFDTIPLSRNHEFLTRSAAAILMGLLVCGSLTTLILAAGHLDTDRADYPKSILFAFWLFASVPIAARIGHGVLATFLLSIPVYLGVLGLSSAGLSTFGHRTEPLIIIGVSAIALTAAWRAFTHSPARHLALLLPQLLLLLALPLAAGTTYQASQTLHWPHTNAYLVLRNDQLSILTLQRTRWTGLNDHRLAVFDGERLRLLPEDAVAPRLLHDRTLWASAQRGTVLINLDGTPQVIAKHPSQALPSLEYAETRIFDRDSAGYHGLWIDGAPHVLDRTGLTAWDHSRHLPVPLPGYVPVHGAHSTVALANGDHHHALWTPGRDPLPLTPPPGTQIVDITVLGPRSALTLLQRGDSLEIAYLQHDQPPHTLATNLDPTTSLDLRTSAHKLLIQTQHLEDPQSFSPLSIVHDLGVLDLRDGSWTPLGPDDQGTLDLAVFPLGDDWAQTNGWIDDDLTPHPRDLPPGWSPLWASPDGAIFGRFGPDDDARWGWSEPQRFQPLGPIEFLDDPTLHDIPQHP